MIDPNNREVLTRVYRLVEKYETPPKVVFEDDAEKYFSEALSDCMEIVNGFPGNRFARVLPIAVYDAIDERFKSVNEFPLKEREPDPVQQTFI